MTWVSGSRKDIVALVAVKKGAYVEHRLMCQVGISANAIRKSRPSYELDLSDEDVDCGFLSCQNLHLHVCSALKPI